MPLTWNTDPVALRATAETCERCGRAYVRGQESLTAFCPVCAREPEPPAWDIPAWYWALVGGMALMYFLLTLTGGLK